MATEEGLRIKLGATVDQLKSDINQAKAAISGLAQAVGQESSQVAAAGKNWNQLGKFIFDANYERRRMIQQINQGVGSWKLEATAVNNVAGNALPAFTRSSRSASTALTGLTRIAQDAPYGFLAIGNNISETILHMQNLSRQSGGLGNGLKALGSSLIGPGGIVLGLNLVITGITAAVQKYGSLGAAVDALLRPLSAQAKFQREVSNAIDKSIQDTQSEIVSSQRLFDVATKLTAPMKARKEAVAELREQYPAYLKDFSDEQILAGQATTAYDKLKDSLIRTAKVKALLGKITENQNKVLDLESERDRVKLQLEAADAAERAGLGEKTYNKIKNDDFNRSSSYYNAKKRLLEIDEEIALNASRNSVLQIKANSITDDLSDKADKRASKEEVRESKRIARIRTVSDVLSDMQKELLAIDNYNELVGFSSDKLATEKLVALNKAFEDIAKIGGPGAKKALADLSAQINILNSGIIGNINPLETRQDIFQKPKPIDIKQPVNTQLIPSIASDYQDQLAAKISPIINDSKELLQYDWNKAMQEFEATIGENTSRAIQGGVTSIAVGIGESIGDLIAGKKDLAGAFNGIISVFAGFIKQLGESMIASGTAALAAKVLVKNPATAIAAGILAVAAGSAIQASLNKAPKLAVGGITNGPTMAMIGDNPSGKEVVAPLERLQSMLGGGYNGNVRFEIEGTKLVGILDRYDKLNNRG